MSSLGTIGHFRYLATVHASTIINGVCMSVVLHNITLAPSLAKNLLSPSHLTDSGHVMHLNHTSCCIMSANTNAAIIVTIHHGGMLIMPLTIVCVNARATMASTTTSLVDMHHHLSHISKEQLVHMIKSAPDLKGTIIINNLSDCLACIKGKLKRTPISKGPAPRVDRPMAMVHSDICGPFDTQSIYHKRYFVSFIDDYSHFTHVYFMATKDEVFAKFKEFIAVSPHRLAVHVLQLDNGGKYTSRKFQAYLEQHSIAHQPAPPHTPELNGVTKRFNSTIINMAQSMLTNTKIPHTLWTNHSPHQQPSPHACQLRLVPIQALEGGCTYTHPPPPVRVARIPA